METRTSHVSVFPLILFILLAAVAAGAFMSLQKVKFTTHARTSHGEQISEIKRCFDNPKSTIQSYVMSNGRYSQHCSNGGKNGYWRVLECRSTGELLVVTQFKQAIRKVTNYITNHGMQELPYSPTC